MMFKNTQRSLLTAKRVYLAAFNTPSWAKSIPPSLAGVSK